MSHGCSSAARALGLAFQSLCSSCLQKSTASGEMSAQALPLNLGSSVRIDFLVGMVGVRAVGVCGGG